MKNRKFIVLTSTAITGLIICIILFFYFQENLKGGRDFSRSVQRKGKKFISRDTLPVYEFILSRKDIKYFDEASKVGTDAKYRIKESSKFRKVKLIFNGEEYDVRMALFGDYWDHFENPKKSFQIKTERDKFVNGMRRINFILPQDDETYMVKVFAQRLADKMNLLNIRSDFVHVTINGIYQGIYYLEEKVHDALLENNDISNAYIVKLKDSFATDEYGGITLGGGHITAFDFEVANLNVRANDPLYKQINYVIKEFFDTIRINDINKLKSFIDVDFIALYDAWRTILGATHDAAGENLRYIYKLTDGKFYPVSRFETFHELEIKKGSFNNFLNIYANNFIQPTYLFTKDDEMRHRRNKKLYELLQQKEGIVGLYKDVEDKYLKHLLRDKTMADRKKIILEVNEKFKRVLKNNFETVENELTYAKCYINVVQKGNKIALEIIPDSNIRIAFSEFNLDILENLPEDSIISIQKYREDGGLEEEFQIHTEGTKVDLYSLFKHFYFSSGLDENLYPTLRKYKFSITFDGLDAVSIKNLNVKMKNVITGEIIPQSNVAMEIAEGGNYYEKSMDLTPEEFINKYDEFKWSLDDNNLALLAGKYVLDRDMIMPRGLTINIQKGVKISMGKNKSIISYSPLNINGTRNNPVVIKALNKNKPFGVVGIVGEYDFRCKTDWLELSGGSEKYINGVFFSGGLSIYHSDVEMRNTTIHNNNADDGLNVKYGNIVIDNCNFSNNLVDQVDLDFCTGVVKNSVFKTTIKNENGDGIDFSGSKILLMDNEFNNFDDKGVSIGEETEIVLYQNTITNNNNGVAVKDLSNAFFIENGFINNQTAIAIYQKKQVFGGGYGYSYNNNFKDNRALYNIDKKSKKFDLDFRNDIFNTILEDIKIENISNLFDNLYRCISRDNK